MTAPTNIAEAVLALPDDWKPDYFNNGVPCAGAKFHSPNPLIVRPYDISSGLPAVPQAETEATADVVWLCSTCEDNLTVYLAITYASEEEIPWLVRREFGNQIRALGARAAAHREVSTGD